MIITYNIDINKNRGAKMEEQQRVRSKVFLIIIGCLLLLKFAVQMYEARKFDEAIERASERAKRENEASV